MLTFIGYPATTGKHVQQAAGTLDGLFAFSVTVPRRSTSSSPSSWCFGTRSTAEPWSRTWPSSPPGPRQSRSSRKAFPQTDDGAAHLCGEWRHWLWPSRTCGLLVLLSLQILPLLRSSRTEALERTPFDMPSSAEITFFIC